MSHPNPFRAKSRHSRRGRRVHLERLENRQLLAATVANDFVIDASVDDYQSGGLLIQRATDLGTSGFDDAALGDEAIPEWMRSHSVNYAADPNSPPFYFHSSAFFRVAPGQTYQIEGSAFDVPDQQTLQLSFNPVDAAGRYFGPIHTTAWNQSENTTLLEPIEPGDTHIEVADASTWSNDDDGNPNTRALAIFSDAQHPETVVEGRYTFNVRQNARDGVWSPGGITPNAATGGYTITLNEPWQGDAVAAGTTVRNADGSRIRFDIEHETIRPIEEFPDQVGPRQIVDKSRFVAQLRDGKYESKPVGTPTAESTWPAGTHAVRIGANVPFGPVKVLHVNDRIGAQSFGGLPRAALSGSEQTLVGDTPVGIAEGQDYYLTVRMRSDSSVPTDTQSAGYQAIDAGGNPIEARHVMRHLGSTDTTLAQTLSPGDIVVALNDASGWSQSPDPDSRSLAWYGFTDADGTVHENYTYTRNVASDPVNGLWSPSGLIGNFILLNEPWGGPLIPTGTAVRNATGGDETFHAALMRDVSVDDEFQTFDSESIEGTWTDGIPTPRQFPPGTTAIKAMVRANTTDFQDDDSVIVDSFHVLQTPPQRITPDASGRYSVIVDLEGLPGLDGQPGDVYQYSAARYGTVERINDTQIRYTAPANFVGSDTFFASLQSDWNQYSRVRLTVRGANHQSTDDQFVPQTIDQSLSDQRIENEALVTALQYHVASDQTLVADGIQNPTLSEQRYSFLTPGLDGLTFTLLEGPSWGVLDFRSDGTFTFKPELGLDDSFRYAVFDGVRMEEGTVDISVASSPDEQVTHNLETLNSATWNARFRTSRGHFPVGDGSAETPFRDADGTPFLSWRVHILPELGFDTLYEQFRLDEPWDSPHNLPLSLQMPAVFGSGEASPTNRTRLQRITSPLDPSTPSVPTGFEANRSISANEIIDGHSQTIMLAQVGIDRGVVWTQPQDASFDQSDPIATLGTGDEFQAIMFDGSVIRFDNSLSNDDFRGLASRAQGDFAPTDVGSISQVSFVNLENRGDHGLSQIAEAMREYERINRNYAPAPHLIEADGRPHLSWRVYLLPFIDQLPLFEQFRLDEPWDSPHNLPLADLMPDIFRSVGDAKDVNTTRILAPYGDTAAYRDGTSGQLVAPRSRDLLDGESNTLMLIEAGDDQRVIWSRPDEVNFDPADPLATLGTIDEATFRVATYDGQVHHFPANVSAELFAATVSRAEGSNGSRVEAIPLDTQLRRWGTPVEPRDEQDIANQLREIGLGLHDYRSAFRSFPVFDDTNLFQGDLDAPTDLRVPNLSWRVHILPFLGYTALYDQFHTDEPWDSPHNLSLLPLMPDVFRSIGDDPFSTATRMQMFALEDHPDIPGACRAAGPGGCNVGPGRAIREILDGTANTLMVAETGPDVAVTWTQPADMYYQVEDPTRPGFFTNDGYAELGDVSDGFFALRYDGSVDFFDGLHPAHLSRLITRASRDLPEQADLVVEPSKHVIVESEFVTVDVSVATDWPSGTFPVDVVIDDPTLIESSVESLTFGADSLPRQSITLRGIDNGTTDGPRTVQVTIGEQTFEFTVVDKVDRPQTPSVGVESVIVNDGLDQRSNISTLEVVFDGEVELDGLDDAFSIVNLDDQSTVETIHVVAGQVDGQTHATLTFSGEGTITRPEFGDSVLANGNYRLMVDSQHVRILGTDIPMDGDGNGIAGGQYVFGDQRDDALYAMFGDFDGNGIVALSDYAAFRGAFGLSSNEAGYSDAFDADGDGTIGLVDFAAMRRNFGSTR